MIQGGLKTHFTFINVEHKACSEIRIHAMVINLAYYRLHERPNEWCDERPRKHYLWRFKSNLKPSLNQLC